MVSVPVKDVSGTAIVYQRPVDEAIGHFYFDDQSVSTGVVHPLGVYLCEYNVFRLSSSISYRVHVCFMHKHQGQILSFLCVSVVASTTTAPNLVWAAKYGKDFLYSE